MALRTTAFLVRCCIRRRCVLPLLLIVFLVAIHTRPQLNQRTAAEVYAVEREILSEAAAVEKGIESATDVRDILEKTPAGKVATITGLKSWAEHSPPTVGMPNMQSGSGRPPPPLWSPPPLPPPSPLPPTSTPPAPLPPAPPLQLPEVQPQQDAMAIPLSVSALARMDAAAMQSYAAQMNSAQAVLNPQLLPTDPAARAKMVVIVLMVHNRPKYFARVVKSLRAVRGVRDALLVVSLDFLSAEMDAVARSIDFMPVVQIFCPAAAQLYPTSFPGTDPRDCAGGLTYASGGETKRYADHPVYLMRFSIYGIGVRRLSELGDARQVWALPRGKIHSGWVLYVEEDNYLAPDVMATLNQMIGLAESGQAGACGAGGEGCPLLNLGLKRQEAVSDLRSLGTQGDAVAIDGWQSSKHNMGLAFKRSFWDKLAGCGPGFCGYDDYNWDWSLQATMYGHPENRPDCGVLHSAGVMVLQAARVYHFGSCES